MLIFQSLQNLDRKASNQVLRDTYEVIVLDEVIEIDREKLEGNNKVFSKQHKILDSDNVVLIVLIMLV